MGDLLASICDRRRPRIELVFTASLTGGSGPVALPAIGTYSFLVGAPQLGLRRMTSIGLDDHQSWRPSNGTDYQFRFDRRELEYGGP
jgi:hypothetical protein